MVAIRMGVDSCEEGRVTAFDRATRRILPQGTDTEDLRAHGSQRGYDIGLWKS